MENETNEPKIKSDNYWPLIIAGLVVLTVWLLSCFGLPFLISEKGDRGVFGDSFGAVNALFSGLAMAGIIYTIHLQRKELGLQRIELQETRRELSRSADAQEKSEQALKDQIASMKVTAKLNALNSLLQYHKLVVTAHSDQETIDDSTAEMMSILSKIQRLLGEVDGDDSLPF